MNKKKSLVVVAVILLGVYLGASRNKVEEVVSSSTTQKSDIGNKSKVQTMKSKQSTDSNDKEKQIHENNISFSNSYYKENSYLKELLEDPNFVEIYKKSKSKFKNYEFSEDLAVWLSIGVVFDSSAEYGNLFEISISKLNEQKNEVFEAINQETKSIKPEDSFLRQQLINVVGVMDIEKDKKISFFGSEASRKVVLDENGDFTPDSMNITNSIAFLKQSGSSIDEAKRFFEQSLSANTDPRIQEELKIRFNTYFPGAVNL